MRFRSGRQLALLSIVALFTTGCSAGLTATAPSLSDPSALAPAERKEPGIPAAEKVLDPAVKGVYSLDLSDMALPFVFEEDEEGEDDDAKPSLLEKVLEIAHSLLGAPYAPGGSGPKGFDCSGLVQYVFRQIGIDLPRTSGEQYGRVSLISLQELQPGDLLFFKISKRRISHVGIYVEDDRFIHAPSPGKKVSYASLSEPYWQKRFVGAGRLPLSEDSES